MTAGPSALPPEIAIRCQQARAAGRTPEQSLAWARSLGDGLGRGLDPESITPIAACHFLGLATTASCNGHNPAERPGALPFPWIDFPAPRQQAEFLLSALPSWTIVQRGQGAARSYRLNPKEVAAIDDCSYQQLPNEHWQLARQELQLLAQAVLSA